MKKVKKLFEKNMGVLEMFSGIWFYH